MKPLKELKPTTIWKYRSDLRKYQRMSLDKSLSPEMRAWAAGRVRHFEEQLGIKAQNLGARQ